MSTSNYQFLPYSRHGSAAGIAAGNLKDGRARAKVSLVLHLTEREGAERHTNFECEYGLLGPGDVTGFETSQVVRMAPGPKNDIHEANYLAHIEFAHPDLPWLLTPNAPNEHHQLKPWINLIVLEDCHKNNDWEIKPGAPNPTLTVSPKLLPDLNQSWAWAHVQVATDGRAADLLKDWESNSGLIISRLICPRKLEKNHSWVACVVPTFALGVQAGLGEIPKFEKETGPEPSLAWSIDSHAKVRLPVFHYWRFKTGPAGDFETLAQKLTACIPDASVGERSIWLHPKASRLAAKLGANGKTEFEPITLHMGTAISNNGKPGPLSPISDDKTQAQLRQVVDNKLKMLVNLTKAKAKNDKGKERYVVGPPIYGRWHAQMASIDDQPQSPDVVVSGNAPWLTELNADPEMRAAAALGTRIVQQDQEALMAQAWQQLQSIADANRRARWSQVFLSTALQLHKKRLEVRSATSVLRLTSPALGRLIVDGTTVATRIVATSLPLTVVGAAFGRATRFAAKAVARSSMQVHGAQHNTGIVESLVPIMLTGSSVLRNRFTPVQHVAPEQFRDFFKDPTLSERVTIAMSGLTLDDSINKLKALTATIPTLKDRIVLAPEVEHKRFEAGQLDDEGHVPDIGKLGIEPGGLIVQQAGNGAGLGKLLNQFVVVPGLVASPTVQAVVIATPTQFKKLATRAADKALLSPQIHAIAAAAPAKVGQPLHAFAVAAKELPTLIQPGGVLGKAAIAANTTYVLSEKSQENLNKFVGAITEQNADKITAVGQNLRMQSVLFSQFNHDYQFGPPAILNDSEIVKAVTEQMPPIVTLAEQRTALRPVIKLDTETVKQSIVDCLEPLGQYTRMLKWALPLASERVVGLPRRRSPAHQIMAAPRFPDAVLERLKRLNPQWLLGHSEKLPLNSISILITNARFVEALLVGANYEMARELQWRRYPTDLMGTCFAHFWSSTGPNDIAALHEWTKRLGENGPSDDLHPGEDIVVVVRGDLLRVYPNTDISAIHGRVDAGQFIQTIGNPDLNPIRQMFPGFLDPDITYAGLAASREFLRAPDLADKSCWYIALTQPMDEPKFGLDENPDEAEKPAENPGDGKAKGPTPDDLSWQNLASLVDREHLTVSKGIPNQENWKPDTPPARWGPSTDAGQIATLLFQRPFQVLLKASDYIANPK
ncbi:hypothetical protein PMI35_00389 [Pseudomonas sp. GM78]|uniref:hypothetical protein n=1 Tax=Pseudomonas sp. GM78 TaxID=1144337 RepID=UPI00026F482E|nr:hypothetical protein [Pseudomonas sp. GM78]EJN34822.1 hypothetical protein PMI35_00389 [Pseudomonas sp. GM78]